jgi:hypothetical protein
MRAVLVVIERCLVECKLAMSLGLRLTERVVRAQVRVILVGDIAVDTIFSPYRLRRTDALHDAADVGSHKLSGIE